MSIRSVYLPKWSIWLFLVVGLALGALAAQTFIRYRDIRDHWKTSSAAVTSIQRYKEPSKKHGKYRNRYEVHFTFVDLSGTSREFERNYRSEPLFAQGASVEISFDPGDASNVRLADDPDDRTVAIVLLMIGAGFIAASFILVIFGPFDRVVIAAGGLRWEGSRESGLQRVS